MLGITGRGIRGRSRFLATGIGFFQCSTENVCDPLQSQLIAMQHEDPANLQFNIRPDRRPRRRESRSDSGWWWAAVVVMGIVFVLLIRTLLDRTASTAGPPSVATQPAAPVVREETPIEMGREQQEVDVRPGPSVPTVYRCVDGKGGVSLQSHPCGPGHRTTREVAVSRDFRTPMRRPVAVPSPSQQTVVYSTGPSEQEMRLAARRANCATARRQREQTLERVGLRRDYDLLQRLDRMVANACKGL